MAQSCKIIAISNQKGGVGKTTTAVNLAAALSEAGQKVLLIDLDPQGNASTGLGIRSDQRDITTYDLIFESDLDVSEIIQETEVDNLDIVPANTDLSSADLELVSNERRSYLLKDALLHIKRSDLAYDYIFIDCPPSLNLLTVNALVSADSVLVPLQCEFFALEGLSQLMLTLREVRESGNASLRIEGVVLTMHDKRNNLSRQVENDARETLGEVVFDTVIPRNVRLSEAPSFAMPILQYDSESRGAKAYRDLAAEIMWRQTS